MSGIHCDDGFECMLEDVKDQLECTMNYGNPQDHEPRMERNNRTVKNQVRVALHRSTHKTIPKIMTQELVEGSAEKLNLFPARKGISSHYSPETLVTGKSLDYNKHCTFEFGDCVNVTAWNHPRDDMRERTLDGVYLQPADSDQGGHRVMDLTAGKVTTRGKKLTATPLTETVKNTVEQMAINEGINDE